MMQWGSGAVVALTAFVALAAAACTGDDPAATPALTVTPAVPTAAPTSQPAAASPPRCTAPGAGAAVELRMWHSYSGDAEEHLAELVAEYNALGTGITVVAENRGSAYEVLRQFQRVPDANLPDIMGAHSDAIAALADSAYTVPPGDCAGRPIPYDDLLPVAEATYTVDGALAAVPYSVSTPVLYFNATAFRAAGLDPTTPPRTLPEVRDASDRLVESGVVPHGLVVYDTYGGWLLRQGAAQRGEVLLQPGNGRTGSAGLVPTFLSEASREAFEWARDGVHTGSFLWLGGNSGIDDLVRLIDAADGAAMTLHTSGSLGELIRLDERIGAFGGRELGVAPMPGPAPGGLVGGGALWLVDRGDAERVGAAWQFVDWLMEPSRLAGFAAFTGYAPVRTSAAEVDSLQAEWAQHPQLRVGYDQLAAMPATPASAGMLATAVVDLQPLTDDAMTRVIEGEDVDAVLTDIESQFAAMLAQPAG